MSRTTRLVDAMAATRRTCARVSAARGASSIGGRGAVEPGRDAMRVVVTGAAGFVGYHVAKALQARGDEVLGMDAFSAYYPVQLKRDRANMLRRVGVEVAEGDVNDAKEMRAMLEGATHLLHLAAQPGVRYASRDAKSYADANLGGFVNVAEAARREETLFVYASSSSVYGDDATPPFREDEVACQPLSLYAATKRANELIANAYSHTYGMHCTGLRFFTVYGPWGRPDMAVSSFTKKILKGETLRVFQGPQGLELGRDFTYIDDIVQGCLGALDTAASAPYRIYNLGNTRPVTVTELVETLAKHLDRPAITQSVPMPQAGDVLYTHADVSAACRDLGYAPQVSLEEGLRRTVSWYLDRHGADGSKVSSQEWNYEPF